MKKGNLPWLALFGAIAVVCVIAWVFLNRQTTGTIANVYQNDVCIASIELDKVTEAYTFTVTDEDGHENTVSVEPGRICVSEANCPDQVCVGTGWISSGLKPIVCLPAKLVIRVEDTAQSTETDFDGVVG